jgi:tetratricopeptide (TPR) repeat protein
MGGRRGPDKAPLAVNSLSLSRFLGARRNAGVTEGWVGRTLLLLLFTALAADGAFAGEPDAGYRQGLEALHAGRLGEAQATAQSMLNVQPRQAPARQIMGLVKLKRGDLPGALVEFDKALVSDPAFIPAREERAVILARLGQAHRARADLEALKARAAACAKTCPPELRPAVSRVEAALAASRPPVLENAAARPVAAGQDL